MALRCAHRDRAFEILGNGMFAIIPQDAENRDLVALLDGGMLPLVMRPFQANEVTSSFGP